MTTSASATAPEKPRAFAALRLPGYRAHFITYVLAMMADNIEHVISYWVAFQKFHSPALGGFAVLSHWLPYLAFSVSVGALNDRFDARRIIQAGMLLFITASLGWGYFFVTDSLTMGAAMLLLVLHGCAGVLWQTSSQMLLHDIVGPALLPSAVRLNATGRYLGVLVGPAVGGVIMLTLGPTRGIFLNTVFYLPLVLWLIRAPYGRYFRGDRAPAKRAVRGLQDIIQTIRDVKGIPVLVTMILLAGGASFFVGNSYQAQMPGFAHDLGHGDPGTSYSMLLAADAAGALVAGFLLESRGGLLPTNAGSALRLALGWAMALVGFACVRVYPLALALLFTAGFFELSFSSMMQTLVQLHAPGAIRGRVLGLFNMSSLGLRAFSGITVGLVGSAVGIHVSLALSAFTFGGIMSVLLWRARFTRSRSV
ncbi:MAG TPA: MFS transporter [Polyangia bacterium]|jgi:MFS family permease